MPSEPSTSSKSKSSNGGGGRGLKSSSDGHARKLRRFIYEIDVMYRHISAEIKALQDGRYPEARVEYMANNPCPEKFRPFFEHAMKQRAKILQDNLKSRNNNGESTSSSVTARNSSSIGSSRSGRSKSDSEGVLKNLDQQPSNIRDFKLKATDNPAAIGLNKVSVWNTLIDKMNKGSVFNEHQRKMVFLSSRTVPIRVKRLASFKYRYTQPLTLREVRAKLTLKKYLPASLEGKRPPTAFIHDLLRVVVYEADYQKRIMNNPKVDGTEKEATAKRLEFANSIMYLIEKCASTLKVDSKQIKSSIVFGDGYSKVNGGKGGSTANNGSTPSDQSGTTRKDGNAPAQITDGSLMDSWLPDQFNSLNKSNNDLLLLPTPTATDIGMNGNGADNSKGRKGKRGKPAAVGKKERKRKRSDAGTPSSAGGRRKKSVTGLNVPPAPKDANLERFLSSMTLEQIESHCPAPRGSKKARLVKPDEKEKVSEALKGNEGEEEKGAAVIAGASPTASKKVKAKTSRVVRESRRRSENGKSNKVKAAAKGSKTVRKGGRQFKGSSRSAKGGRSATKRTRR